MMLNIKVMLLSLSIVIQKNVCLKSIKKEEELKMLIVLPHKNFLLLSSNSPAIFRNPLKSNLEFKLIISLYINYK